MNKPEKPVLLINEGEKAGQRWTIQSDTVVIGRGSECDLLLPERQVSRQHIRIRRLDDRYTVEDLESKNGTWINGQPLKGQRELHDSDEISLGMAVRMVFMESEATAPVAHLQHAGPTNNTERGLRLDREARRVFVGNREL